MCTAWTRDHKIDCAIFCRRPRQKVKRVFCALFFFFFSVCYSAHVRVCVRMLRSRLVREASFLRRLNLEASLSIMQSSCTEEFTLAVCYSSMISRMSLLLCVGYVVWLLYFYFHFAIRSERCRFHFSKWTLTTKAISWDRKLSIHHSNCPSVNCYAMPQALTKLWTKNVSLAWTLLCA